MKPPMKVYEFYTNFTVKDATPMGTGDIFYQGVVAEQMPESTILVTIIDPEAKHNASVWLKLDSFGDDRDERAYLIGLNLLDALDQTADGSEA
jgi:hypothetical protein